MKQVYQGVKGFVLDVIDGRGILNVIISVVEINYLVIIYKIGDYWCFLVLGIYKIIVFVRGYNLVIKNVIVKSEGVIQVNFIFV